MNDLFCEVIGCGAPAAWALPTSFALLEDHLCEEHYQDLCANTPDMAARYRGVGAYPDKKHSRLERSSRKKNHCARAT